MHPAYSRSNPLDLVVAAIPKTYKDAKETLLEEDYIHRIIVIQTLQTMTDSEEDAHVIIDLAKKHPYKPIICTYTGGRFSKRGRYLLEQDRIPNFDDVKNAAKVMSVLVEKYKQNN